MTPGDPNAALLASLTRARGWPSLSLFVPMHPGAPGGGAGPTHVKNLLRQANRALQAGGWEAEEAERFLEPVDELLYAPSTGQVAGHAVAVYRATNLVEGILLVDAVAPGASVADRFRVLPVVADLQRHKPYMILTFSENAVELFDVRRAHIRQVDLAGVPHDLAQLLWYVEREGQYAVYQGGAGRSSSPIHFGSGSKQIDKIDRDEFARRVAAAVAPYAGARGVPLVLFAVDEMQHHFRRHAHIPELLAEGVHGNAEYLRPQEIAAAATHAVDSVLAARVDAAVVEVMDACGTGMGSTSLDVIGRAAVCGRIDSLLVAAGASVTGRLDPETGAVAGTGPPYLLDELAVEVLSRRGRVYIVPSPELPSGGPGAASFRYA